MTAPGPDRARTPSEFVARLRALRTWSGLSYRDLERRARGNGEELPASTVAGALGRATLPRLELLRTIVRACGGSAEEILRWTEAWRALAQRRHGQESPDDASTDAAADRPVGGSDGLRVTPCLLPPDLPVFVGRDAETETAEDTLRGGASLVVTGPAGVGKTAFAVRVGHRMSARFPDGQFFADLHAFGGQPAEPSAVLGTFLRALGVRGSAMPRKLIDRTNLYRSLLADRHALVILDNAVNTKQVRDLLPNGRHCAAVVTSRTTLPDLDGTRIQLPSLTTEQGLVLLGSMIGPDRAHADRKAAQAIVEACGRHPLAVWVAGARLAARPQWPLARIARALADEHRKLDELTVGDVAVRASLELTDRGLRPAARRAWRMLSLLPGPDFAGWALAAQLETTVAHAERLLDELFEVHVVEIAAVTETGIRYRPHDLVRLFGRERALREDQQQDREAALSRVLSASLALAETAATELNTDFQSLKSDQPTPWRLPIDDARRLLAEPSSWFADEHRFLVAIAEHGLDTPEVSPAACLATALTAFFQVGSHFDEWERLQTTALDAALRAGDHGNAARLHRCLGELATILDRYPTASGHFEQALRLAESGDSACAASAMAGLGYVDRLLGRYGSAVGHFGRAADLARSIGNRSCLVYATLGIGVIDLEQGRLAAARQRFVECLAASREVGYRPGEATALRCLGYCHRAVGDHLAAADCFQKAADISVDLGDRLGATHANCWLGDVWVRQGRLGEGRRLLARSLWIYRELGNRWGEAAALHALAAAQLLAGRPAPARRRADAAVHLWRQLGSWYWLANGLDTLAEACRQTGELTGAAFAHAEAETVRQRLYTEGEPEPSA